ncbi:uncharacterized protein LOC142611903 [Castanea sativa]|uniref:uncharacterized protein LOC142611903 n=1 Tax=Castanea sativa TaxID=21020 RepID=UPI003F64EE95
MYLTVSKHAVSAMLLRDQGVQQPTYYISKILVDAETRYLPLEKLVLALVYATRKLPYYFQAHTIYVLIEYPLQSLLKRSDFTDRIAKWETRLGFFNIRYRPKSSVKGQVLADFIAEFSSRWEIEMDCHIEVLLWRGFVDGTSNASGVGARIVIITPEGIKLEHSFRLGFRASNNKAEYEAMLVELRVVSDPGAREVARGQNRHSDSLPTLASSLTKEVPRLNKVELVAEPSINVGVGVSLLTTVEPCWMDPIIDFLAKVQVPADEKDAEKAEATNKAIVNGLKRRLESAKGKWAEELPNVLWAYRTTPRRSTGETSFSLTYGAEAVIPIELNLLEEHREPATIRLAEYQQKLARRYNRDVRRREFSADDLVLWKVVGNTQDVNARKLAPTWEGPYRVTAIVGARVYYLEDLNKRPLPRAWNARNLKNWLSGRGGQNWHVPGRLSFKNASNFQVDGLHVRIDFLYQLPHAGGVLIASTDRILDGQRLGEGYLLGVPQRRVVRHPHGLKSSHPALLEIEFSHFMNNRLDRILSVREASIVPLIFTCF